MKEIFFTDGEKIELTIISLAASGSGMGITIENGFKKPVFVPYTVPGDIVIAQLTKQYKRYYEAKLCEIITSSPHRIKPVCEHFGTCGACDFLHISYDQQIKSKEKLLLYSLKKVHVSHPTIQLIAAKQTLHYRAKVKLFSQDKEAGFIAKKSNTIVPIKKCSIIYEELNKVFASSLEDGVHNFAYDEKTKSITDSEKCFYTVENCLLAFYPNTFVQSNLEMNKELVRLVCSFIPAKTTVLDLYAGNGNFSIVLAKKGNIVTAVEGDKKGYDLLCANKQSNEVSLTVFYQDVKTFLEENTEVQESIILDPPRTGALEILPLLTKAKNIVYVSCNAQNLGKELKYLCDEGYTITEIYLLDLFPQTRHFETIINLKKKTY
jgi:23S rRNA (uracil1939-C5)-methyltransferase